jgi:NADPH:quinone reductase
VSDLTTTGCYAQYRTLRADRCVVVDPSLDPAEATSLVLSWMTAYQLLHRDARVQKGQKLLVIGAAGAVGQALIIAGRLAGCEMWGTARSRHAGLVNSLGASFIDSDQKDYSKLLPDGFDAVFDGIAEKGFSRSWAAVGSSGHLSAFGVSAGIQSNVSILVLGFWMLKLFWWNTFSGRRSATFYSITSMRKKHPDWFVADLGELLKLLARGEIKPPVAERIALEQVADALARIEHGGLQGKIVLMPNG